MTRDGQIEVGPRWTKQKWGAHARTANQQYNNYGIGVCLVGNFDLDRPTSAQLRSVARLTAHLMRTYKIPASRVIGHGETKPTDCPGRHCSIAEVRRLAAQYAIDVDGMPLPAEMQAMRGELLHEVSVQSQ
jgi:N-acetyl-anhydromuramyl-L-alanine amidase AmpD